MISKLADLDNNWYRSGEGRKSILYDVFNPKYVRDQKGSKSKNTESEMEHGYQSRSIGI
jgi:hypothetical protein